MSTQRIALYLSLLVHLTLGAGVFYGQRLMNREPPVLVVDFSLSVSEAMAGEPKIPPGAPTAVPSSTPSTAPPQPQAAPLPAEPLPQPIAQPVTKPVKFVKPVLKKSVRKPKKVHKEPRPLTEESNKPAPLAKKDLSQDQPAAPSTTPAATTGGAPGNTAAAQGQGQGQAQARAASGPGGGSLGKGGGAGYDFSYVRQRILKNLQFPANARRMGLSGKIVVSFVLKENGQVEGVTVVSSSGHEILDKAVVATIHRVAPFPRPPVSAQLMLRIVFHLRS